MVYLKINERSNQARAFLEYVKTVPFVEVVEDIPNNETLAALRAVEKGKINRYRSAEELFRKFE